MYESSLQQILIILFVIILFSVLPFITNALPHKQKKLTEEILGYCINKKCAVLGEYSFSCCLVAAFILSCFRINRLLVVLSALIYASF